MEIKRFALAFRFPADSDRNDNWNLLFRTLPYKDLIGCNLYCCLPKRDEIDPAGTVLLAIDNLSRGRACRTFETYKRSAALLCAVAAYRPVMQANYLVRCEQSAYLGRVAEDGRVAGGDTAYGCMRFEKKELPPIVDIIPARMLIIGAPYGGRSAIDVCRAAAIEIGERIPLATSLMLPVASGTTGLADALVRGLRGRYREAVLSTGERSFIGVLPDYSAVVDESYLENVEANSALLGEKAANAILAGCRSIYVSAGASFDADGGAAFAAALSRAYPEGLPADVRFTFLHPDWTEDKAYPALDALGSAQHARTLSKVLEMLGLGQRLTDVSHVVWAAPQANAGDEAVRLRAEKLAKALLKRFVTVRLDGLALDKAMGERITQLSQSLWA